MPTATQLVNGDVKIVPDTFWFRLPNFLPLTPSFLLRAGYVLNFLSLFIVSVGTPQGTCVQLQRWMMDERESTPRH